MEIIEAKLEELEALLKAAVLPTITPPGQPGRPAGPSIPKPSFKAPKIKTGVSVSPKKDPVKVAAQLKDPDLKVRAKEQLSFNNGGQWALGKSDDLEKARVKDMATHHKCKNCEKMMMPNEAIPASVDIPQKGRPPFVHQFDLCPDCFEKQFPKEKKEDLGKGIKNTIAAGLVGASMLGNMAHAAPAVPHQPDKAEYHSVDTGSSSPSTMNIRTYGPYQVTTALHPSADSSHSAASLTHSVSLVGDSHSPQHAAAIAKEFKIDKTGVLGLKDKKDVWVHGQDKAATTSIPGHTPNLWNPPTPK